MAISQELVSIKSAGVYRREFDLSTMQPTYESTYSRGRIVPGFSYKGPFNKPFKINDSDQFVSIFGNIDPKLEANGCFFHRTAIEMLKAGPIIALNLHSYGEAENVIDGYAIGTKFAQPFASPIKGAFSTALWYEPWPDRLRDSINDPNIITLGEKKLLCDFTDESVVTWSNLAGGDDTENGTENSGTDNTAAAAALAEYDYLNVIIFSEDINKDSDNLWYIANATYKPIGRAHLCRYIPNPDDPTGASILDENVEPVDVLIYPKAEYLSEPPHAYTTDVDNVYSNDRQLGVTIARSGDNITLTITDEPEPSESEVDIITIDIAKLLGTNDVLGNRILSNPYDTSVHLNPADDETYDGQPFVYIANASGNDIRAYVYKTPSDTSSMLAYNIPISDYYGNDIPFELQEYLDEKGFSASDYTLADFMFTIVIFSDVKTLSNDMISLMKSWGLGEHASSLQFIRMDDALFDCNGITGVYTYTGASVPGLTNAAGTDISIDTFLRNLASTTNIIGFTVPYCEKGTPAEKKILETSHMDKIEVGVEPCASNPNNYKAILHSLRDAEDTPLKYAVTLRNKTTGKWESEPAPEEVYGHTNMWKAITDRMVVSFRYLVDCWGYGIEPSSKAIFAKVCMAQHATGLLNAPSALALTKVEDFTDEFGSLNYKAIATSDIFTVPNIKDGATHVGYFYPWNRKGAKLLPPAGVVSNLFIQKDNPWSVAAGTLRGVLPGYNPEVPLSTKDREWLEAMGINAIIDAGDEQNTICVYGNKTAKQKPVSALSALSFRDFVVYIMDEIENIIRPYVFQENTESIRTEIVSKCNTFLKSVTATPQRSGGLTAFEVIMNSTNNTAEIIDNFYGVLDIKIEGARPMEKLVQRCYILPTGALTSNAE